MSDLDDAYALFEQIRAEYAVASLQAETEAEARMRLVDRILFDCLGWPRSARLELVSEDQRLDYLLRDAEEQNWVIVEAKRPSVHLVNPDGAGKDGTQTFKLSGPALRSGRDGGAWAIIRDQVAPYGARHGTPVGVVTNGEQWIGAAVPSRSGRPLEEERAVLFASLDHVARQFERFYNYFSRVGVRSRILERHVLAEEGWATRTCRKPLRVVEDVQPLARLGDDPGGYYAELSRALDIVFDPIEDDPHIIEHCFVESRESKDADDRLGRLTELLTEYLGDVPEYESTIAERTEMVRLRPLVHHGTLALLTGELSAGKTSYIRRFYFHTLSSAMRSRVRFAHVRFDKATDLYDETSLGRVIASCVEQAVLSEGGASGQFFDLYRREWKSHSTLFGDAEDQKKAFISERLEGQRNEPLDYARRLMMLCVTRHARLPCVVLDGFDHLDIGQQRWILNAAVSLYRETLAVVTVVADDTTLWRLRRDDADRHFSDHCSMRLWLPRPKVGDVLHHRFAFLKRIFEQGSGTRATSTRTTIGRGLQWTLEPDRVASFLRDGLLFENATVRRWIEMLANYDIRAMLGICRNLILSPAVRKEDVFAGFATGSFAALTEGKLMRALIRPRHRHYKADPTGFIHNVMNFNYESQYVPLGPFLVLSLLDEKRRSDRANSEQIQGFLEVRDVMDFVESTYRIPSELALRILVWLRDRQLAQTYDPSLKTVSLTNRVKITPRGQLHLEWACAEWHYLREMGEVDDICDESVCAEMRASADEMRMPHGSPKRDDASRRFARTYVGYLSRPFDVARMSAHVRYPDVAQRYQQLVNRWT